MIDANSKFTRDIGRHVLSIEINIALLITVV